jgi:hypothetical protein
MQFLTSIVLSAFVGYAGAWYLGMVEGNFALLLFMATVVTGIYWLAERFVFPAQSDSKRLPDWKLRLPSADGRLGQDGHQSGRRRYYRSQASHPDAALVAGLDGRSCSR